MAQPPVPINFYTFEDLTQIVIARAKIAGQVQTRDYDMVRGFINEHYINIVTERNWTWRKMDRSFLFAGPLGNTTGVTCSVTLGSRAVVFTGITVDETFSYRTLNVIGTSELYRVIGIDISANAVYLEAPYIQTTSPTAQFRLYQYEFALPPDCDIVNQVYVDGNWMNNRELDYCDVLQFNRALSNSTQLAGPPQAWTQDGNIPFNATAVPLDVMLLNYDFLGGENFDQVNKIRLFPIWPDQNRLIHVNYSRMVAPMSKPTDRPIIPVDDCSVLIHFALYEWWKIQGNKDIAAMELRDAQGKLKEMRDEFRKTDPKPQMILNGARYRRYSLIDRRRFYLGLGSSGDDGDGF